MKFEIAKRNGMCSTLILWGLGRYYTLEEVVVELKRSIRNAESPSEKGVIWDNWAPNKKGEYQILDGHPVDEYAFIVGTLDEDEGNYDDLCVYFKEIGFTISKPQYNDKNDTFVALFYIPVKKLLDFLKKYNDNGNLIKKVKERKT